ncbi:MAG TPA: hypothetical protein VIF62_14855 [Labilithrix sp.]
MHRARIWGIGVFASVIATATVAWADNPAPAKPAAKPAEDPWKKQGFTKDKDTDDPATEADAKPISATGLVGYASEGLKFGVGARAGYTLPQHIYVGGTFVYHFGEGNEVASVSAFYPAGEVGYDFRIGRATIRPYGGGGVLFVHASVDFMGQSQSATKSYGAVYPGLAAFYDIPDIDGFYVGGDARVLFNLDGGNPSVGVFANAGVRF